jgi:hypothetical protein
MLIDYGADINGRFRGNLALNVAISKGLTSFVGVVIEKGLIVNINASDSYYFRTLQKKADSLSWKNSKIQKIDSTTNTNNKKKRERESEDFRKRRTREPDIIGVRKFFIVYSFRNLNRGILSLKFVNRNGF